MCASRVSAPLAGVVVDSKQMAENLGISDGLGEQRDIADLVGKAPSGNYFGAIDALIDESLDRATRIVKERP